MRVTVQLFARLREITRCDRRECEVAPGSSVADVWQSLVDQYPPLEPFGRSITCAVNAEFARMTAVVRDGDAVAFLPPVSGGAGTPWQG